MPKLGNTINKIELKESTYWKMNSSACSVRCLSEKLNKQQHKLTNIDTTNKCKSMYYFDNYSNYKLLTL